MTFAFLTQADRHYASRFRVLHESIRRFHPDNPIVLATWDTSWRIPSDVQVMPIEELASADPNYKYSRPKAQIVQQALKEHERVVYLGADMEFFAPLPEDTPWDYSVVLVPHVCTPIPFDNRHPNDLTFLIAGDAQGDFQIWRRGPNTVKILNYYEERLSQVCRYEPQFGLHYEQPILTRFPWIFDDCYIWRTTQVNVSYWAASRYDLRRVNSQWMTKEGPLVLAHFTGFDENRPSIMSRHQRGYIVNQSLPLFLDYAEKLRKWA